MKKSHDLTDDQKREKIVESISVICRMIENSLDVSRLTVEEQEAFEEYSNIPASDLKPELVKLQDRYYELVTKIN